MGLRDAVNQHPKVVLVAAAALAVLIFVIVNGFGGGTPLHGIKGTWFYDTGNNQFYVVPLHTNGPMTAPSGEGGVKAVIYTCKAACGNADLVGKTPDDLAAQGMHLVWYQKLSPEGAKLIEGVSAKFDPMMLRPYQMIRFPDEEKWRNEGEASTRKKKALQRICPDGKPLGCLPGVK